MTEAEKERAAVIDWMRGNATALRKHAADERQPLASRASAEATAIRDDMMADAISRGDHLTGRP